MKIVKRYDKNFTVVSNDILKDTSISWKAKGIFVYLWSMPNDWDFYEVEVTKRATDGRDSLRSGLKELENKGYITRKRKRNNRGQVSTSYWELSEKPMLDKPTQGKPTQENPTLLSTNSTKDLYIQSTNEQVSVSKLSYQERFDRLWSLYPNKKGKKVAFTKYKNAVKEGTQDVEIEEGIKRYLSEIDHKGTANRFIKHGSTWFSQQGWQDDYETKQTETKVSAYWEELTNER